VAAPLRAQALSLTAARIGSGGRALDCTAEREVSAFDSRNRTKTQGLKITGNEGTAFQPCERLDLRSDDHRKMAVPSSVADVKIVSSISTLIFVLNTLTLK